MDGNYAAVGRRIAKGALWTVLGRASVRVTGLLSTLILARLLLPSDFGLVALATMLFALLELFGRVNAEGYLFRIQQPDRSHYDTGWTLNVLRGLAIAAILAVGAPHAAAFFEEPRIENVLYAIAVSCAIEGFVNIGIVDFRKNLDFGKDFRLATRTKAVAFFVTVVLALVLRDYWALVLGVASRRLAALVLSYTMHPYRPRLCLTHARDILGFAKWMIANGLLYYAQRRSYAAILGKLADASSLGLFTIAREVSSLTTSDLVAPIQRVLLPGLAKLSEDIAAVRRAYLDGMSVIVMFGLPLATGVGLTAEPLVRVALGPNWLAAIPLIQILAIAGLVRMFTANNEPLLLALNMPQYTTVIACFGAVVGASSMIWAAWRWGMVGAAWATSGTAVLQLAVNYAILWRKCGITPAAIGRATWRSIAGCLVMAVFVRALVEYWPWTDTLHGQALQLTCVVVVGGATYFAVHVALWHRSGRPAGPERYALSAIASVRAKLAARRVRTA